MFKIACVSTWTQLNCVASVPAILSGFSVGNYKLKVIN